MPARDSVSSISSPRTVADVEATGAVNRYHTDPDAPVPAGGSPVSRVAPSVLPVAGSVVTAFENKSLGGDTTVPEIVRATTALPFAEEYPSTCTKYVVPGVMFTVRQL
jgi:alpha-ketoglutarate-dependent taurine dioxygenase